MRLSIAIIEFHCMDDVLGCLDAVNVYLRDLDHECIVISNSCYGEDLLSKYKLIVEGKARIVSTGMNLGYAGGVNVAIQESQGQYLYILNPDCRLMDAKIAYLMNEMDSDNKWAISGPKVVDDNNVVQPSCRRFPKPWTFLMVRSFLKRMPGAKSEQARYLMGDYGRDSGRFVDWVSGGGMLVKKSAVLDIGGMDERYFLYMEDVDWCRRAWEEGYKVAYWPLSSVCHAGQHKSISVGRRFLLDRHLRWHITSLAKYFIKYGFRSFPTSKAYRDHSGSNLKNPDLIQ